MEGFDHTDAVDICYLYVLISVMILIVQVLFVMYWFGVGLICVVVSSIIWVVLPVL